MEKDENFTKDEEYLCKLMDDILKKTEQISFQINKAEERKSISPYFNCAALLRARKLLVALEKVGVEFRKTSVKYSRGVSNEKRESSK